MKGYLSVREIAAKWKVSERRVNQYIQEGRVPGTERFGKSWAIPEDAEKPERQKPGKKAGKKKPNELLFLTHS
ncbi:MAG: helix-turn-helix domain-containing protein [Clostridia bacterium]|nr:helix-turn-helix domain-containing protein [Clostridia bacterium]